MRLQVIESKNAKSFYVVKSTYINKKRSSKVIEKLGTYDSLLNKLNGEDPFEWAEKYVKQLTQADKELKRDVLIKYSPSKQIPANEQRSYNGGYLFLQKIYYALHLHSICEKISQKYKFSFDLNSILSRLIYGRIIFPSSKLATYELSKRFIEQPKFEIQHVYRSLEVIANESDFIQSELYNNSLQVCDRKKGILYYDCTNYFFEIEQEEGLKQYGLCKQHQPNPIVQMGLFIDGGGIPLAFCIGKGNENEQLTLKPLEERIISDFKHSRFIVCTDAGLSSTANRKFNNVGDRAFITTQSIKKLKKHIKEWALGKDGWQLGNPQNAEEKKRVFNLEELNEKENFEQIFFKERWINEDDLEQRMIVTFSLKYKNYHQQIRSRQIERAERLIDSNPSKIKKSHANDYKRLIAKDHCTKDGEIASKEILSINTDLIDQEATYDGFYAVCTNLEDTADSIIDVNRGRWEIEESFRILKTEFKARPVYLKRDDRIAAHFTTCFIALMIYRIFEKKLGEKYTCHEMISCLRDMNFLEIEGEGYIPTYTRTDFTDALHDAYGFRTDYEIVNLRQMKNIFKETKK